MQTNISLFFLEPCNPQLCIPPPPAFLFAIRLPLSGRLALQGYQLFVDSADSILSLVHRKPLAVAQGRERPHSSVDSHHPVGVGVDRIGNFLLGTERYVPMPGMVAKCRIEDSSLRHSVAAQLHPADLRHSDLVEIPVF